MSKKESHVDSHDSKKLESSNKKNKFSSRREFMRLGFSSAISSIAYSATTTAVGVTAIGLTGCNHNSDDGSVTPTTNTVEPGTTIDTASVITIDDTLTFTPTQGEKSYYYKITLTEPLLLGLNMTAGPSATDYNPYISCEVLDSSGNYVDYYEGIVTGTITEFSINTAGTYILHFNQISAEDTGMTINITVQQDELTYSEYSNTYSEYSNTYSEYSNTYSEYSNTYSRYTAYDNYSNYYSNYFLNSW